MVSPFNRSHANPVEAGRGTEDASQTPQQRSNTDVTDNHAERPRTLPQTTTLHYSAEKALETTDQLPVIPDSHFVPPHSSYALSALPNSTQNYGTAPSGVIGQHHPKEIIRVERDWSDGEVCRFHSSYPMELEGRVNPQEFRTMIDEVNTHLERAYSQKAAVAENILAILTWHTSLFWWTSKFEKELRNVEIMLETANKEVWNQRGLNVLSPRSVALQYLEIEYV